MFRKFTLSNGITVLLQKVDGVVSVSSGLWLRTGSRNENADECGYAHFLEHMLFKGTAKYSAQDMARMVDRVGGQHNGATNKEYTCYYINIIADHLEMSLELISDMFYNSLFLETDIEKEKGIILEEIRMYEDYADEHVLDTFTESMFAGHPLAHNILGTRESIASITREKLMNFYEREYRNDKAVISIAGNFDVSETERLVKKYFSDSKGSSDLIKQKFSYDRIYRKHIDREIEQVHFALGFDGLPKTHEDRYALFLLSTIFGGSSSSRLFQNIREREGLCYSVFSFHSSYSDNGLFGVYCSASPEKYEKAKSLILDECRLLREKGVSEDELADAKSYLKGSLALSMESVEVKMGHNALEEMTFGRKYSFEEVCHFIDKVKGSDIERIIKLIFASREVGYISIGRIEKPDDSILYLY